jgi:hypothetical protein
LLPNQCSGFRIRFLLTPETMNRFDLWQSRSALTWPKGPGFGDRINDSCFTIKLRDISWGAVCIKCFLHPDLNARFPVFTLP